MRQDQLETLTSLRDRLLTVAVADSDPVNWVAAGKKPSEMSKDERGDAAWCRRIAIQSVALTLQVQRLMQNPAAGGAVVPTDPAAAPTPDQPEEETMDAEIDRYERAAAKVLSKAAARKGNAKP